MKTILKATHFWYVVRVDNAASASSSHQVGAGHEGSDVASDLEYARDVACWKGLQVLGEEPFAIFMQFQENPRLILTFLHE